jgi:hypothetical protein
MTRAPRDATGPRPRSRRAQAGRAARRHHRGGQSGPRSRRDLHRPAAGARARWRRSGLGQRRRSASSASLTCWVAWNWELKT